MEMEDFATPRASFENQWLSSSLSLYKSFFYTRLREEPMKLSVRKLDGSFFDVEIKNSATIAELKLAVEYVFSQMLDQGSGEISWPHVWGHFCLCYDGQKLVSDTDQVVIYGIKDGDQLHFVRHVSSIHNLTKNGSKNTTFARKQYMSKSSSSCIKSEDDDEEVDAYDDDMVYGRYHRLNDNDMVYGRYHRLNDTENQSLNDMVYGRYHRLNDNENQSLKTQERQFPLFRKGWSYSRTPRIKRRMRSEYNCSLLCKLRNMIHMWDCSKHAPKSSWRED